MTSELSPEERFTVRKADMMALLDEIHPIYQEQGQYLKDFDRFYALMSQQDDLPGVLNDLRNVHRLEWANNALEKAGRSDLAEELHLLRFSTQEYFGPPSRPLPTDEVFAARKDEAIALLNDIGARIEERDSQHAILDYFDDPLNNLMQANTSGQFLRAMEWSKRELSDIAAALKALSIPGEVSDKLALLRESPRDFLSPPEPGKEQEQTEAWVDKVAPPESPEKDRRSTSMTDALTQAINNESRDFIR